MSLTRGRQRICPAFSGRRFKRDIGCYGRPRTCVALRVISLRRMNPKCENQQVGSPRSGKRPVFPGLSVLISRDAADLRFTSGILLYQLPWIFDLAGLPGNGIPPEIVSADLLQLEVAQQHRQRCQSSVPALDGRRPASSVPPACHRAHPS